jgi:hypothetical protein
VYGESNERPSIEWRKPLLQAGAGMAVGYVFYLGTEVWENDPSWDKFEQAFQEAPEWDPNPYYYNWVLHPLWGSETYLRAREAHFGVLGSFLFSTACSVFWEYAIEGWVVHPSQQDLLSTSPIGSVLGEARYQLKRRLDDHHDWWLDPLNSLYQRLGILGTRDRDGHSVALLTVRWSL